MVALSKILRTTVAHLQKDGGFVSPTSATSGIAGYSIDGVPQRKRKHKPRYFTVAEARAAARAAKTESVDHAAHHAAASPFNLKKPPTEAQASAGNYAKGHVKVGGVDIAIENPAGSKRRPEWPELKSHYGYAKGTTGADDDAVDVFIKVGTPLDYDGKVLVIDQMSADGGFDEHKCMIGWDSTAAAEEAYFENYTDDWRDVQANAGKTWMSMDEFKDWLQSGDTTEPAAASQET